MRFNLEAARKATESLPHREYTEAFAASDNLRWSLSNETVAGDEKPLGKADPAPSTAATSK
jgi:hypothetical protein